MTIRRIAQRALRYTWKAYVVLCIIVTTLIVGLNVFGAIVRRLDIVQLPNGTYLAHRSFFSLEYQDIILHHPDGRVLINDSIGWVCFNEQFVKGTTYNGPRPGFSRYMASSFIYEKGQDEAILNTDSRYYAVLHRSALRHKNGCGIEGALKDFYVLLKDPNYGR